MTQLAPLPGSPPTKSSTGPIVPALIAVAGDQAAFRYLEFFAAQIRNPNTRRAYARAVGDFLEWLEHNGIASIAAVTPVGGLHGSLFESPDTTAIRDLGVDALCRRRGECCTRGIKGFNFPYIVVGTTWRRARPDVGDRPLRHRTTARVWDGRTAVLKIGSAIIPHEERQ